MADFEKVIRKHLNDDGIIPADAVAGLAQALAKYVGENFVDVARYNTKKNLADELQEKLDAAEKYKNDYDKVKADFDKYKTDQTAKELRAEKSGAYKGVLKSIGIPDKFHAAILRATNLDELDFADGKFKAEEDVKEKATESWKDFAVTVTETGIDTPKPPANDGSKTIMTKAEIMQIKDTAERQKAIAENHELFGF